MKELLLAILIFVPFLVSSQTLSREAVTSGGDVMQNGGYELSCSIGQLSTATLTSGSGALFTQGFQQI